MRPPSQPFIAEVKSAYAQLADNHFSTERSSTPPRAESTLKAFVGTSSDVAKYEEKAVHDKRTFAAYVPGADSGDILIVDGAGHEIARGTNQDGNLSFDWS